MTNKEFAEKIKEYLLMQDPELVADMCAYAFLDLNRFLKSSTLSKKEAQLLIERTRKNTNALYDVVTSDNYEGIELVYVMRLIVPMSINKK